MSYSKKLGSFYALLVSTTKKKSLLLIFQMDLTVMKIYY